MIYIVTGAGGQILYDIDQEKNPASWQTFTTEVYFQPAFLYRGGCGWRQSRAETTVGETGRCWTVSAFTNEAKKPETFW